MSVHSSQPPRGNHHDPNTTQDGLWRLRHPVLPLVRMVLFLFLTGPFKTVRPIVDEMVEPIETDAVRYDEPAKLLEDYLHLVMQLEVLKSKRRYSQQSIPAIVNDQFKPVGRISNVALWVCQQILNRELEQINSLLCGPCDCVLCCTGPDYDAGHEPGKTMRQDFFEIPLSEKELDLFDLETIDSEQSRKRSANSEPYLRRDGRPFYETGMAIYRWRNGWSLILPRKAACSHLDQVRRICNIYPQRPEVCRRPQIFPYMLEKRSEDIGEGEDSALVYVARKKLLAVWDCPYVQKYKEEIAAYAEMSGLEPVFMANKE